MGDSIVWILWVVLGVVLIIAEVFTPGFVLLWFGIGAPRAAVAGEVRGGGPGLVLPSFLSLPPPCALLAKSSRRRGGPAGAKRGGAGMPGQVGPVVTSSRGALDEGAVKVL